MALRYSLIIASTAALILAGCDSGSRATASYSSSVEANALAAEAAEEEFAKQHTEHAEVSKSEVAADAHSDKGVKDLKHAKAAKKAKSGELAAQSKSKADKKGERHDDTHAPKKSVADVAAKTSANKRKPASGSPPTKNNVYILQVGAFRIKENAERLHAKLETEGYPVLMRSMTHSKNGELFLVRMEPTPNRDEAETMREKLKTQNDLPGHIIVRPEGD